MLKSKDFIHRELVNKFSDYYNQSLTIEIVFYRKKKIKGDNNAEIKAVINLGSEKKIVFGKLHSGYKNEFEIMKSLWNSHYKTSENFKIPEPILIIDSCNLLVMEYISGTPFKKQLYSKLLFPFVLFNNKFLVDSMNNCLNWLIDFESFIEIEKVTIDKYLNPALEKLNEITIIKDSNREKYRNFLVKNKNNIKEVPEFLLNNDFRPQNIFLNNKSTIVFDWSMAEKYHVFTMVFSFLRPFFALQRYPFYSKKVMKNLIFDFINKYKDRTRFENFSLLFPYLGVIYEIDYLHRVINYRSESWSRNKSIEISLKKIEEFLIY